MASVKCRVCFSCRRQRCHSISRCRRICSCPQRLRLLCTPRSAGEERTRASRGRGRVCNQGGRLPTSGVLLVHASATCVACGQEAVRRAGASFVRLGRSKFGEEEMVEQVRVGAAESVVAATQFSRVPAVHGAERWRLGKCKQGQFTKTKLAKPVLNLPRSHCPQYTEAGSTPNEAANIPACNSNGRGDRQKNVDPLERKYASSTWESGNPCYSTPTPEFTRSFPGCKHPYGRMP